MNNEQKAAEAFAKKWAGKGDEKQDSQRFWIELLGTVYGVENPAEFVRFEQRVKLSHTSYIDVMIPATHTMIEQKSLGKDLAAPIRQSDGTMLKPIEQAKRYAAALPYSDRPRWIVSCNFAEFQIYNMERPNDEPERVALKDLGNEYYRLKFLVDVKDSHIQREMQISRDAGTLVGKIYDALLPCYGAAPTAKDLQDLNKLIVRLVFCFYAEDAGLFGSKNAFRDLMETFNAENFRLALITLFHVLDQKEDARDKFMDKKFAAFPYVNGSLFTEDVPVPPIDEATRRLILDEGCGFDWSKISPTIFGAIFESTLNPATRRHGGMHYTSIENIHKVIDPLFLDDYKEKFQAAMSIKKKAERRDALMRLQRELASVKYFDPACGSGNFLTESYLSLRRLENDILREVLTDSAGTGALGLEFADESESFIQVSIKQFHGIEINDFAVSVAKTAMWIAEAQMLEETETIVHQRIEFLPLTTNANIHEGNALTMDWRAVLPPTDDVKIMGNPPFVGARMMKQGGIQKREVEAIFGNIKDVQDLDYVCCWYKLAAQYMQGTKIEACFVSTNSITQGAQVPILWQVLIGEFGVHINFAYRTFKWQSESTQQAAVHCVIICFAVEERKVKYLYQDAVTPKQVSNISPYLLEGNNNFVVAQKEPLCDVPKMSFGNQPRDGGHLILSEDNAQKLLEKYPELAPYVRPYMGAEEFLNGKKRFCLWLVHATPTIIKRNKYLYETVEAVLNFRLASKAKTTRGYAKTPALFAQRTQPEGVPYLIIPRVSSENRRYIPIGFLPHNVISSDAVQIVPNAEIYHFGVLESNVHMSWMRTFAGRLKSDYRYSKEIVYNTFPWPTPTDEQRTDIERTAQSILDARALYPESSLADLYDEVLMPKELREAHRANDRAVMRAYGFSTKMTESECVAELMKMYEEFTRG
ncbi:MAG: DNA methyltransferase [Selenomonadaceae bacterium]